MKTAALGHALALAAVLALVPAVGRGVDKAAMLVDRHEVSAGEFQWFMERERGEVFRYFQTQYHLQDGKDFWEHDCGGTSPGAVLRSNTVARVTREKVEQMVFQELGLARDISYGALLARFEKANQQRKEAAEHGRAIYGPVRYTQLQFYEHWKATLRLQAQAKLAAQRWQPAEEDLRRFYDRNREAYRGPPACTLEVVTIQPAATNTMGDPAALLVTASNVLSRFTAGGTLTSITNQAPWGSSLKITAQRYEDLNLDRLSELFPDDQQAQLVRSLSPGEVVGFSVSNHQARVVRCLGWVAAPERSYEAVSQQVRDRWLAQRYEAYLSERASKTKAEVNEQVIQALIR